ncbi:iron-siderophore ABC transporter substrate-binding protein [Pengzhenrongella frigida]|uniref:iron-siderophore ABC transporter substrate-binding protein n=1 Tax=Pengzhenrongella frigida TaxID=1259133 RepID=UPI001F5D1D8C|nr:iron-siderophore ABC transporter substrate-binding protein [Cellulomonas sp. HLT2-17]
MHLSTPLSRPAASRSLTALAAVGAVTFTLAACGSGDDAVADVPADDASTSSAAFPVTITSTLGDATIEKKPERVVAIGWGAADITVALGTIPVGVEADTWGGDADGFEPWFRAAVEEQGGELPEAITIYPEIDVEAIIGLNPDLILATQSGLDQATFDQLSEFAPVVAYPGEAWATSSQDQITIAAEALGVPEKGDEIVADVQRAYDEVKAAHPEFAGTTFAYVYGGDQPGALGVYMPGDSRVALLTDLGLQLAPSVSDLEPDPGSFYSTLGLENADTIDDVDVLFTWFNDTDEQAATEAQPLWQQIPAFSSSGYLPMIDRQLGMAVSVASPLSIPWALDTYVPQIAAVVAKVS